MSNEEKGTEVGKKISILEQAEVTSSESNSTSLEVVENNLENIIKPDKKNNNKFFIVIAIIVLIIILLLLSTIFAILNLNSTKIINGVTISGIDISNLTKEEATEKVTSIINEKLEKAITLKYEEQEIEIFPEQLSASFDIDSCINLAYEIGRSGNIFENNFDILSSLFYTTNISPSFSYNEDALSSLLAEFESNLPDKLVQPSYYIDGSNLIIIKGTDGIVINYEQLKFEIMYYINNFNSDNSIITIPTTIKTADEIDIEKIYSEVYKEAQDAYYTTEPFAVYTHVDGVDFAISIEEAKALLQEDNDSYTIPLKFIAPAVTVKDLGAEAFPNLLATYTTTYSTTNVNRSTNIRLASEKINGTVLMPGETFSYNTTVGQRTAAAGFKEAAVYAGGEVTTGIGGGICQVSSTLYNTVLLSNLEIVERTNHGFNPGYVPAGRDATVSWGGPDFKFKNTRNYPIKIVCTGTNGKITAEIYGFKEENEYEVEITSYITSYIQYKTITKEDSTLAVGTTKVTQSGSNGCKSVAYRILKQNGQVISKTLLSTDTYNPHNKIISVGTKAVSGE